MTIKRAPTTAPFYVEALQKDGLATRASPFVQACLSGFCRERV